MGREQKNWLRPSHPIWSKPLPFLAASAFAGVMMLIRVVTFYSMQLGLFEFGTISRIRILPDGRYVTLDTDVIFPGWVEASFLIGFFVLMVGITMALFVYTQNRDTSRPASRRDTSKKMDLPNAVHAIFDFVSLLVPRRLANEELGDALEVINREIAKRRPRWRIWLKVGTTLFWITINSLRWISGAFRGRRRFR